MDDFVGLPAGRTRARARRHEVERPDSRRLPGGSASGRRRKPRRRDAVFHRIEGAQHRASRSRDRPRLQAERVRGVPRRGRSDASPASARRTYTRRSVSTWIPPELRELRGEIEAAESTTLPRLIDRARSPRRSAHAHHRNRREETICGDGGGGRDAGLEYIAITDHRQSLAMANGLDERRALAHAARIRALDAEATASGCWPASNATSEPTARSTWRTTASPRSISSSPRCIRRSTRTGSR